MHRKLGAAYLSQLWVLKFWVTKIWTLPQNWFYGLPCWLTIYTHERKVWVQVHYHASLYWSHNIPWKVYLVETCIFGNRSKLPIDIWEKLFSSCQLHQMPCSHLKSNLLKYSIRFSNSIVPHCHMVKLPLLHVTNIHPQLDYFYDGLTKGSAFYWMHSIWAMMYVFLLSTFDCLETGSHPNFIIQPKKYMPWQKRVN